MWGGAGEECGEGLVRSVGGAGEECGEELVNVRCGRRSRCGRCTGGARGGVLYGIVVSR